MWINHLFKKSYLKQSFTEFRTFFTNLTLNRLSCVDKFLQSFLRGPKTLLTLFMVGFVKKALTLCKTLFKVGFCERFIFSQNPTINRVLQSFRAIFTIPTLNRVSRVYRAFETVLDGPKLLFKVGFCERFHLFTKSYLKQI